MEQIRTFVAIELDRALKDALRQAQRPLKDSRVSHIARWVSPDSIHLTLKFLGNVPVKRLEEIGQAISQACKSFAPFHVSLADLGCFPHARRLRVIWVGVGGDLETLMPLQKSVEAELSRIGFAPEKRPFRPHLTLARVRDKARPHERQELAELMRTVRLDVSPLMMVREICLMRSDLRPSGAVYTRLSVAPLGEE